MGGYKVDQILYLLKRQHFDLPQIGK